MDGKSSRRKGANGEREFAALLRKHGFDARRFGRNERADSDLAHNVPGIHFEVKRRNRFDPVAWLRQARDDAGVSEVPVAAWRRNNGEWIVLLGADEFLDLMSALIEFEEQGGSGDAEEVAQKGQGPTSAGPRPPLDEDLSRWEDEGGA